MKIRAKVQVTYEEIRESNGAKSSAPITLTEIEERSKRESVTVVTGTADNGGMTWKRHNELLSSIADKEKPGNGFPDRAYRV